MATKKQSPKKLMVGNWKMNPEDKKTATQIFQKIKKSSSKLRKVDTVVCAPHVFLSDLGRLATGKRCVLGGQDCHYEPSGSYTGETSPLQLRSAKAQYVVLGHSERRRMGETDEIISQKVKAALQSGLNVILCVGEEKRDKDGRYLRVLERQLLFGLQKISKSDFDHITIAYEPVWAIGESAKRPAKPDDVFEMKIFTRRVLTDKFGKSQANRPRFLYGGSADDKNAEAFLTDGQADGLLVGRASRNPEVFARMLEIAEEKQ